MDKQKNENNNVVDEKVNRLKKVHGELTKMTFKINGQTMTAYLRQPSIYELDATLASLSSAPISSSVGLFNTCFVDGDKELIELSTKNSGLAIAINKEIQKIVPNVHSESTNV